MSEPIAPYTTPPAPATGQLLPPERLAEIEARHAKGSPSAPWNGEVFDLLGHITALTEQAAGLTLDAGLRECRVEQLTQQLAACENALTERDERVASLTARLAQEGEQERELLKRDEEARKLKDENTRLLRNAGYGGIADEAPDEIHLCGDPVMGCDAWLHIDRVEMIDGEPAAHWQEARANGRATDAVRYVKAGATLPTPGAEGKCSNCGHTDWEEYKPGLGCNICQGL